MKVMFDYFRLFIVSDTASYFHFILSFTSIVIDVKRSVICVKQV